MPDFHQVTEDELLAQFRALREPEDVAALLGLPGYPFLVSLLFGLSKEEKYIRIKIPKRSGGTREIHKPIGRLKNVQSRLLQVLQVVYKPKDPVHGFVKGRSIRTNAQAHARRKFVLNIDLRNFFPSINYWRVRGMFKAYPYNFSEEVADVLAQICSLPEALPQGAPTSPIISNMICAKLDYQLQKLAKNHHCFYTRYADDITFSTSFYQFPPAIATVEQGEGENQIQVLLGQGITSIIEANGFKVNQQKVRLQTSNHRQEVTGLVTNKKVNVNRQYVSHVRAMLHAWEKYGYEAAESVYIEKHSGRNQETSRDRRANFRKILKGKIEFLGMVRGKDDPLYLKFNNKAASLERKLPENPPRIFQFLADPSSPSVLQLIQQGEQHNIEFKMGACLNKLGQVFKREMSTEIWISVAAMLNEVQHGYVLLGVTDEGEVLGVEREYETADQRKSNWDGYSLYLDSFLREKLRSSSAYTPGCYKIDKEIIGDHTIAIIRTTRSRKVVWVDRDIYVRKGNKSEKLRQDEIEPYIKMRA